MFITDTFLLFTNIFKILEFSPLYYKKKPSAKISFDLFLFQLCNRFFFVSEVLYERSCPTKGAAQQFSLPTIWRHATTKTEGHPKQTKGKGGRQSKLSLRDERSIIRSLRCARKQDGNNFSSKRIKLYSGVSSHNDRTLRRVSKKYGYHYRQARRKGLLTENDLKLGMKFAKDIKKYYDDGLRLSGICFYLDAKHFIHKTNPMDQARAPKSLVWRKKNEGLI